MGTENQSALDIAKRHAQAKVDKQRKEEEAERLRLQRRRELHEEIYSKLFSALQEFTELGWEVRKHKSILQCIYLSKDNITVEFNIRHKRVQNPNYDYYVEEDVERVEWELVSGKMKGHYKQGSVNCYSFERSFPKEFGQWFSDYLEV